MSKCSICHEQPRAWACQPFGPDDAPTFALPGHHYRGFPAIACCDACKVRIQAGEQVAVTYRKQSYVLSAGRVFASPF